MRVHVDLMEVGSCRHPACMVTGRASLAVARFPALVACIIHPVEGVFLFDTGYGEGLSRSRDPVARAYRRLLPYRLTAGEACCHQLAAAGIDRGDVRGIILSHLHPDHAGGLVDFPGAAVFTSAEVLSGMRTGSWRCRARLGLISDLFPISLEGRTRTVESCRSASRSLAGLPTGADLLGDGSLIAIPLPGHAPGHIGLLLTAQNGREVLLAADAAWLSVCIRERLEPMAPARAFVADYPAYRRTLHALHDLSLLQPDLCIVPSHCGEAIAALRHELC
ncbi:MBL fold metallo-hydrolase [Nitrospirillum viridazoti]|uniref:MBL fold metallo-hydrolase n=1 Tax=Nitrospirillum viridazoti CBAmc TaxID=1441467 RepID=A0A248K3N3_9PROT|nr:MBL fold metallo-hydrolase [Nitrospirillum amazonense]ASG25048.1 MBL fold metallo-hydrolase [Nitrospirillum amazonense CBAmc]TWB31198.1 metallo-beta-lactamase superfamily protein [Nitrospirillum amazonense]